jgi:hypothetical protein
MAKRLENDIQLTYHLGIWDNHNHPTFQKAITEFFLDWKAIGVRVGRTEL